MDPDQGRTLLRAACQMAVLQDRVGRAVRRAVDAADSGNTDAALSLAGATASAEPRCTDATVILACLLEHEKSQGALAARHFRQAIAQDPSNPLVLWYAARHEMRKGNTAVGLALLCDANASDPLDSYVTVTLAWYLGLLGKTDEAKTVLGKLTGRKARLMCQALESILLATVDPSRWPGMGPRDSEGRGCTKDLQQLCCGTKRRDALGKAILERAEAAGRLGQRGGRFSVCAHLENPAVPVYTSRYGKRIVAHYAQTFCAEILGPEAQRCLRLAHGRKPARGKGYGTLPSDMVVVPAGQYVIGDTSNEPKAPKRVHLPAFLIDRYPVTNRQWQEFLPTHTFRKELENHPVVNVDFLQATLYARWKQKRLPTEAEWESAASGPDGWRYPWGDRAYQGLANCAELGRKCTTPVTQFPRGASPCGARDMLGNAQEWVQIPRGPITTTSGRSALKGGGFNLTLDKLTCRWQLAATPLTKSRFTGFRCARDL